MGLPKLPGALNGCAQILGLKPYEAGPEYEDIINGVYFRRSEVAKEVVDLLGDGANKQALDVAAGTGIVSQELHDRGFEVTAIDLSEDFLHYIRKKRAGIQTVVGNMNEPLPFQDGSFDCVTTVGANRYFTAEGFQMFLKETHRVLKNDGRLVFPVLLDEYLSWRGDGIPFPPSGRNIGKLVENAGFSTKIVSSLGLHPLRIQRLSYILAEKVDRSCNV